MTLIEKKNKLIELTKKLNAINEKVSKENRDITDDEQKEFDSILNEADSLKNEIMEDEKRAAKRSGLDAYLNMPATPENVPPAQNVEVPNEERNYGNIGEWLVSPEVRNEQRAMSMGNAGSGGILVPEQFSNSLLMLGDTANIVRSRATVLGAGDPPDAKITIPILNQMGANGIDAGMSMQWIDEGGTKADTTPEFSYIELEPKEIGGSTIITEKLLRNAPALSSFLQARYRMMVMGKEDYQFLRGNGVGKPQGVIGCPAEKVVARNTANQVLYTDIRSMLTALYAESWGKAVWVANQTVLPYIINLVDGAGNTLFIQGDATKGVPATLFGMPIIFTGKTPVLGTKGDLMLCDFSYYLIKDGSGPYFATSEHVYFTTNKIVVKMYNLVDGAPWVKSTLLLEDGSTTVSPFVVLQ